MVIALVHSNYWEPPLQFFSDKAVFCLDVCGIYLMQASSFRLGILINISSGCSRFCYGRLKSMGYAYPFRV